MDRGLHPVIPDLLAGSNSRTGRYRIHRIISVITVRRLDLFDVHGCLGYRNDHLGRPVCIRCRELFCKPCAGRIIVKAVNGSGKRHARRIILLYDLYDRFLRPVHLHGDATARRISEADILVSGKLQRAGVIVDRILCSYRVLSGIDHAGACSCCKVERIPAGNGHSAGSGRTLCYVVKRHASLKADRRSVLRISGELEISALVAALCF